MTPHVRYDVTLQRRPICFEQTLARRHQHPSTPHGRYDVTSQRRPICFLKSLRVVTCIHGVHMEDTTSYRKGFLYVYNKSVRDVTCIHRPHMEDTTSHRNGGLYVFQSLCATSPASIDFTWKRRRHHIATGSYMFLKSLCATSPASIDPTWRIQRHIATEAYMFSKKSMRHVT